MKKLQNEIEKKGLLYNLIIILFFIVFVIIYNIFCREVELYSLQIKIGSIKKFFVIETLFYFIYTFLGNIITLFFMEKENNYKEIVCLSIPFSFAISIVHNISNIVVGNIFIILFYFMYRYLKSLKISSIISTFLYIIIIFFIQFLFYVIKFKLLGIDYNNIDSSLVRFLLGLDYYIFMYVIILIKNKVKEVLK